MKVGDFVVTKEYPDAVPARILIIEDLGYGEGFERVKVLLLGLVRYYAKEELQVVEAKCQH